MASRILQPPIAFGFYARRIAGMVPGELLVNGLEWLQAKATPGDFKPKLGTWRENTWMDSI
jgi:hypothetical protein